MARSHTHGSRRPIMSPITSSCQRISFNMSSMESMRLSTWTQSTFIVAMLRCCSNTKLIRPTKYYMDLFGLIVENSKDIQMDNQVVREPGLSYKHSSTKHKNLPSSQSYALFSFILINKPFTKTKLPFP